MKSIEDFNREERRKYQKIVHKQNMQRPKALTKISKDDYPKDVPVPKNILEVWHSQRYMVQIYKEGEGIHRISVCRTSLKADLQYEDNITWDELQAIKSVVGFKEQFACEVYPPDKDIINVANMRHLWVFDKHLGFGWRKQ